MSAERDRLVEIGKRFLIDEQLLRSVEAAGKDLVGAPSFKFILNQGGPPECHYAGRIFGLKHEFTWTPDKTRSRVLLCVGAVVVAEVEIGDGGAVWCGQAAAGLTLPQDAAEVVVRLLLMAGGRHRVMGEIEPSLPTPNHTYCARE